MIPFLWWRFLYIWPLSFHHTHTLYEIVCCYYIFLLVKICDCCTLNKSFTYFSFSFSFSIIQPKARNIYFVTTTLQYSLYNSECCIDIRMRTSYVTSHRYHQPYILGKYIQHSHNNNIISIVLGYQTTWF